jgi:hypothetical protein
MSEDGSGGVSAGACRDHGSARRARLRTTMSAQGRHAGGVLEGRADGKDLRGRVRGLHAAHVPHRARHGTRRARAQEARAVGLATRPVPKRAKSYETPRRPPVPASGATQPAVQPTLRCDPTCGWRWAKPGEKSHDHGPDPTRRQAWSPSRSGPASDAPWPAPG